MFDQSCGNLLVRGVNWIGDSVMTLPALRSLRRSLPDKKISLLIKPWVSPVFENNPDIDELIIYGDEYRGTAGKMKLSRMIAQKKFGCAILFQNAFEAALIAFLAGIKERAGYRRDGRGFLLTSPVQVPQEKEHQVYYYLRLLERLGIDAEFSCPYIYLKIEERLHARDILRDMKRPILGINPGATYGSAKRWLPERFAEIADWFIKENDGSVIIFGGKNEINIAQEIEFFINRQESNPLIPPLLKGGAGGLLNLAGKTSLRELISLISECDVFVTNDSGPLHIAYAVRTPEVAIFGSTDPRQTGPLGKSDVVVASDLKCSPCFESDCKSNDMRCMYEVTSDDVYYGIKSLVPQMPAVFFDRDGTLCKDSGYISNLQDLHIFPDIENLVFLKRKGFRLIGVSNQSGVARGKVDEDFVKTVNEIFKKRYGFDDFYYCPHHPDEHCPCRKPEPEMILRAKIEFRTDLRKSYVVGDKETDMLLAKAVGAKGVLVTTGEAKESQHACAVVDNLEGAVRYIIKDST
ncbi:MAG: lipopolysaccharide heptosyltransferase II [Nitrospirota bacterium]